MNRKRVGALGSYSRMLIALWCFLLNLGGYAQIEMTQTGLHVQNFNSLSMSGSANAWVDNQTIPGWYWQCDNAALPSTYMSDDGTSIVSGRRCYGTNGDSDRAMGGLCEGINKVFGYGIKLHNSSSNPITNISISYTGEQWKVHSNRNFEEIKFFYKITSSPEVSFTAKTSTNGWKEVSALNFVSPQKGPVARTLNGNDPANRVIVNEYSIPLLDIPSGSYIYFRWDDPIETSGDHGLAIDDVTIKWIVPPPVSLNIWNGSQSNDWFDNRNWSNGIIPGPYTNVEIPSTAKGAVCNDNVQIKSLKILNGGQLTIEPQKTLTVDEASIFEGQNCLILKSPQSLLSPSGDHAATASFLSKGTVSGLGSIKVERFISQFLSDTDGWHLFSSPVNYSPIDSQFLPTIYDELYFYWEEGDEWLNQKTTSDITNFVNGVGYLMSYYAGKIRTISGLPNNSDLIFNNISFTSNRGWHLLGNPFPCGLRWEEQEWKISGMSGLAKLLNNGGTYTDVSAGDTIPAMNGFFVKATSVVNTITIPKSARIHAISSGWKHSLASNDKKIKLVIKSTSDNTYAETNICLNENATRDFDERFDSDYLSGMPGTPLFYSLLTNDRKLSTNSVPESTSMTFNFDFAPGLASEYTLSAQISDAWTQSSSFMLEDRKTNLKYAMSNSNSFKFISQQTDLPNRFRLVVDRVVGINDNESVANLNIYNREKHVYISFPDHVNSGRVAVFDLSGKQIYSTEIKGDKIDFYLRKTGFYICQLNFNEKKVNRKIYIP